MSEQQDDLTVLKCWRCGGGGFNKTGSRCWACGGSGNVFWVDGRSYAYTPEGEVNARRALKDTTP